MIRRGWILAALLPVATAAADEVILTNGATFSGIVREEGDRIVLELDFGTMTLDRSKVRAIRRSEDPLKEYPRRLETAKGVEDWYALALWARERDLETRARDLFKKVVSLEPDHEGARKALGYERVDGRWLAGDALREARGLVRHGDRWVPPETAAKLGEEDARVEVELGRRASEERIARMRQEVEFAKIEAERERVETLLRMLPFVTVPWRRVPCTPPCDCGHPHVVPPNPPPAARPRDRLPPVPPMPAPMTEKP